MFANATKSTRFMTPPSRGWMLAREAALSLSVRHDFARGFADPRQMQAFAYTDSPLTKPGSDLHPRPGALAANVRLEDGSFLLDQAGPGFSVLLFGKPPDGLADAVRRLDPRAVLVLLDPAGRAAHIYGATPGSACLLRPDLHIAARWPAINTAAITAALRTSLGLGT